MKLALRSIVLVVLGASVALAQQSPEAITVVVGQSVTFQLPRQPQIIGVEDPAIASLEVLPDGRARVTGKREGRTRIVGRDNAQLPMIFEVKVVTPPPPPTAPPPQQ